MDVASDATDVLSYVIAQARRGGGDAADAVFVSGAALSHAQRFGKTERLDRAESNELGLRVFLGKRQAIVSSSDQSRKALAGLVERALAMARAVPEDPHSGLPERAQQAASWPDLELFDSTEPGPETLAARANEAEAAALAIKGVTNSEGAEATWSRVRFALASSNGFAGSYSVTRHGVTASVLASSGSSMERDYDHASAVNGRDLERPAEVGRRAGERAVRRLGARKERSSAAPVVYDPRVAGGLLRHLAAAINGAAIARGTSFLKDKLGGEVFSPGITIVDDPHRRRGLASRPFDGEGVLGERRKLVDNGRITTWLLDARSASQLGLRTTGHAVRGTSSPPAPAPSNLYLEPGPSSPAELMADIRNGLYVTELIGFGVNMVTGDYSRGATGFRIENGALAYPVHEITIAGNLTDMFRRLVPANDLTFRYGVDSPTVRIDGMTIAGL